MAESIEKSVAIKSAWMILEGLGFDRARNSDLERTVLAVFESAPAADVVKVVRCSKCEYWRGPNDMCRGIGLDFGADGFCSDGKPREEEDENNTWL